SLPTPFPTGSPRSWQTHGIEFRRGRHSCLDKNSVSKPSPPPAVRQPPKRGKILRVVHFFQSRLGPPTCRKSLPELIPEGCAAENVPKRQSGAKFCASYTFSSTIVCLSI